MYSLAATDPAAVCINGLAATVAAHVPSTPSTTWCVRVEAQQP
eukprot:SAG22_NODE_406_length_10984_cov_28.344970_17_plen_43_part_00